MIPYLNLGDAKWDKGLVLDLLAGKLAAGGHRFESSLTLARPEGSKGIGGAVIIAPVGKARTDINLSKLRAYVSPLEWVVVLATSDECSTFDWRDLEHPNMRLWIQTPRPEVHFQHDRFLVHGIPPETTVWMDGNVQSKRTIDWFFAGQVNHERRRRMVKAVERSPLPHLLMETEGFLQGISREEYLDHLIHTKIALAPSGPCTPDSFRLWEALEAGCVPLVDAMCPAYGEGYWPLVLGDHPLPLVYDWRVNAIDLIDHQLALWPSNATRCSMWWQRYKRDLHWRINDDVSEVSGMEAPTEALTVLIPTSPIRAHPSTAIIEETVASVRFWHPTAEIIVMCDGVRPEQEDRRADYEEYLNRVAWLCEHRWGNTYPMRFEEHTHQIGMTRAALEKVRTPLVLFVEHDTPLVTDEHIDWPEMITVLEAGGLNVVKLHHEALILAVHERLMVDHVTTTAGTLPIRKTLQWSQRPHLARADWYRKTLDRVADRKGMIEDAICGYVATEPWGANRVAIYHPPGKAGIKRSLNLDGRGDDPKWVDS